MNYKDFAEQELGLLGYDLQEQEDGPNKWIVENVLQLLEVLSKQGRSGSSAPYCVDIFSKLARFEPLSPLTGEGWEWIDVGDGYFQNVRCSHVFKNNDSFNGQPYDIHGRIFIEPDGVSYTSRDSCVPITFPYTPKSEHIYVDDEGNILGDDNV